VAIAWLAGGEDRPRLVGEPVLLNVLEEGVLKGSDMVNQGGLSHGVISL